jgi:hypothetical protein
MGMESSSKMSLREYQCEGKKFTKAAQAIILSSEDIRDSGSEAKFGKLESDTKKFATAI